MSDYTEVRLDDINITFISVLSGVLERQISYSAKNIKNNTLKSHVFRSSILRGTLKCTNLSKIMELTILENGLQIIISNPVHVTKIYIEPIAIKK